MTKSGNNRNKGFQKTDICDRLGNSLNMVMNYSEMNAELLSDLVEVLEKLMVLAKEEEREELKAVLQDLQSNQKKIRNHGSKLWDAGKHILGLVL